MTTRRTFLVAATGSAGLAALGTACTAGSDSDQGSAATSGAGDTATGTSTPPQSAGDGTSPGCVLTPRSTEGPYYVDLDRVREDVTEGRDGAPLRLDLTVVRASEGCRPVAGAAFDIWHCDATGDYSLNGASFLRGTQLTNASGRCAFRTIVPGWYAGRAPHIHFKVHPDPAADGSAEFTGQFYLPEDLLAAVYAREPYARRPGPDTSNSRDSLYRASGPATTLKPVRDGEGYRASYVVGLA
ncbi:intradiol ring-cleavage dioxygenase [Streptomyces sp. NPDC020681]|uniref:intradiol ring-cleavage dioxygenase n=1 Tax=Streptomyces sp. NPDC020681 TaxID=3365083 RepID=UPI00379C33CB